jgi:biopolymer transport protein ExbB
MRRETTTSTTLLRSVLCGLLALLSLSPAATAWWDKEWTIRKKITIDPSSAGAEITGPIGSRAVLVRLHDGNFQFLNAKEDGTDIRFLAEDDKTVLPHHIERYDSLLNEAFVWVKVPDLKPSATSFWLYYGNTGPKAVRVDDSKGTYSEDTVLVYHFAESGAAPTDSSGNGNVAEGPATPAPGSIIGGGIRLDGARPVTIPATSSLEWTAGAKFTWSAWIKFSATSADATVFSRRDGASAFVVGVNEAVPFVEVASAAGTQRSGAGTPVLVGTWTHLAVVSDGNAITLLVNGELHSTLTAAVPALNVPLLIGGDTTPGATGFVGELDELQIAKSALPIGALKFSAIAESGSEKAAKLLVMAGEEGGAHGGGSAALEHVMLFGDIAKNMMFDGWIAIGVCVLMIIFGWGVAVKKFNYLNSIQRGTEVFLEKWKHVAADLTALDHDDEKSIRSLGGNADPKTLRDLHRSPLYHLYHIGCEEIRHRMGRGKDRSKGLSARSIQAIRASLESGLVRENQRMNKGLVFLTISIAGGPYVGLLGTVVGVMITFAIIAKSGEVDVNSIAPGIASALLATVAGLVVAIPALFIYSYLSSRIKDLLAGMQVFIDEFIAKMAEFYPTPTETFAPRPSTDSAHISRLAEPQLTKK